jgi:DNA-binding MarR family transcriptional regulator
MSFAEDMNYFYYRSSVNELRAMHGGDYSPGLSYHSMLYLNIIAGTADCTVSKLAEMLQITRSAVTIKVNELKKRSFVEKQQSGEDGRVWFIKLTPRMVDVYAMFNRLSKKTEEALRARHDDNEITLFGEMLRETADFEWKEIQE